MGYFDCACCGSVDMSSNDDNEGPAMCDVCKHLGCTEDSPECKVLMIDGARGIYVPQAFVQNFTPSDWGLTPDEIAVLDAGPDHVDYWDVWEDVDGRKEYLDKEGVSWVLCQDGDLFAQAVSVPS